MGPLRSLNSESFLRRWMQNSASRKIEAELTIKSNNEFLSARTNGLQGGGLLASFLLRLPTMKENKAERKEGEEERVLFWFRHKRRRSAGNKYSKSASSWIADGGVVRPMRAVEAIVEKVCPGGDGEVADGIGQSALASPRGDNAYTVSERIGPRHAKANRIGSLCAVEQEEMAEGSGLRTEGDSRPVGGVDRQRIQGGGAVSRGRACWKEFISGARFQGSVAAAIVVGDGRLGLRAEDGAA